MFYPKTHNQRYHDPECCRIQTNANIMDKYYEEKARKEGRERICSACNFTKLSRWNELKICGACAQKKEQDRNARAEKLIWQTMTPEQAKR